MDRSEINRALAKAMAYKQCGKDREAAVWASILIEHLELTGILQIDRPQAMASRLGVTLQSPR